MDNEIRLFKIILAGDGEVGKTSLRKRFMGHGFDGEYIRTLGADFAVHETLIGNEMIRWQIWDIAGQPEYSQMIKAYYKRCIGAIVVYDITRRATFEHANMWINEIWKNNGEFSVIPLVLVGNKTDLRTCRKNTLTEEEGTLLASELSAMTDEKGFSIPYVETSALSGEGVQLTFQNLRELIIGFIDNEIIE